MISIRRLIVYKSRIPQKYGTFFFTVSLSPQGVKTNMSRGHVTIHKEQLIIELFSKTISELIAIY